MSVVEDTNEALRSLVPAEEIGVAALQMGGLKAPRPNGFQGIFYQHLWEKNIMDVNELVLHWWMVILFLADLIQCILC